MERLSIDILGIFEVGWTGGSKISSDKYTVINSLGQKHEKEVGFVLDQKYAKFLKYFWALSDRIYMIKLDAQPLDINIIQAHAPTSGSDD